MTPRTTILRRLGVDPDQVWQRARILPGDKLANRELWVKAAPPENRALPLITPSGRQLPLAAPEHSVFMSSIFWRRANVYFAQEELELLPDFTRGTAVVQSLKSWLAEGPRERELGEVTE